MSSRQHSDFQYEQFQAAWLASQNGAQLNVGGGLGGFEGARRGQRFPSEFGQFNRSSIPLAVQPSATGDSVDYILRVVAQADHDTLLRSGNEAYANEIESHNGTKEELAALRRAFDILVRTRSDSSMPSNDDDRASMGPSLAPTGMKKRMAYRKEDVPHIKFWTRKDYESSKNKSSTKVIKSSTAEPPLYFMEHEDGTPLTEEEATKMRLTARGVFSHLLNEGTAPAKWGQVSVVSQDFFFNVIADRYPYAAMCEDMWKMQLLATLCFPSWHRKYKEKVQEQQNERERQERERIWIDQQLEHGRQLKEEVMDQVELSEKRMHVEPSKGFDPRPSKKTKTATSCASTEKQPSSSRTSQSLSNGSRSTPTPISTAKPLSSRAANSVSTAMVARTPNPLPPPPPPSLGTANRGAVVINPSMTDNAPALLNTNKNTFNNDHVSVSASFAHQASDSIPSREDPTASSMVSELSVTSGGERPLSLTESIPSVENWAYDRTGLDSTNTQETALDRLSVHDSTPYIVASPLDEQQISLGVMPPLLDTLSMDMPPLREDVHKDVQAASEDLSREPNAEREPTPPPNDIADGYDTTRHNSLEPSGLHPVTSEVQVPRDVSVDLQVALEDLSRELNAEREPTPPPNDTADSCSTTRHNSLGPNGPSPVTSGVQDLRDVSVDVLLALHEGGASGRIRPTAQQPYPYGGSKGGLDFESTFVKNASKTLPTVRNPLGELIKARIPSSNVTPDTLVPMYVTEGSEKENVGVKPKGRGRPSAGQAIDPDQVIKGTAASCTPRNLFALDYKCIHNKHPTEGLWQNLDKTELERYGNMSKEKKASRSKSKAEAGM